MQEYKSKKIRGIETPFYVAGGVWALTSFALYLKAESPEYILAGVASTLLILGGIGSRYWWRKSGHDKKLY